MLSRVLSMVRKDKASSGLALRVGERNSVLLPFNVVLPGPQWCMPICSRCFTAQTATQGTGKAWTSCLDFFPIAVEKKITRRRSNLREKGFLSQFKGQAARSGTSKPEVSSAIAHTGRKQVGCLLLLHSLSLLSPGSQPGNGFTLSG